MRKRRVRVTAKSRRIAVSQVTGCRQIVTEMAAPAELRTPLGTAAKAAMRVRMEAWRQWRTRTAGQNSIWKNNGPAGTSGGRLPFPPQQPSAGRPPVKASLRLAALGLDWARPPCRESPEMREWQAVSWQGRASRWSVHRSVELNGAIQALLDTDRPSHGSRDCRERKRRDKTSTSATRTPLIMKTCAGGC